MQAWHEMFLRWKAKIFQNKKTSLFTRGPTKQIGDCRLTYLAISPPKLPFQLASTRLELGRPSLECICKMEDGKVRLCSSSKLCKLACSLIMRREKTCHQSHPDVWLSYATSGSQLVLPFQQNSLPINHIYHLYVKRALGWENRGINQTLKARSHIGPGMATDSPNIHFL